MTQTRHRNARTRKAWAVISRLYVVIFVSLFGNQTIDFAYDAQAGPLKAHTIMLAGFIAICVVSAPRSSTWP